ncbi:MAG: capsule assembly Wzi family protein [Ignavibacteria bacterium]|nr:capsule assembly Wzi family protein [Ignavibacteria bacterium]
MITKILAAAVNQRIVLSAFITIALLSVPQSSDGQVVYLPTSHEVYPYLKRMEARGLLEEYRDAARPFSRRQIASYLRELEARTSDMTWVERRRFEFMKSEFNFEMGALAGDAEPTDLRWHAVSLPFTDGVMNIDVAGQFGWKRREEGEWRIRSHGLRTYGYAFKNVGFYFWLMDFRESGKEINVTKIHTPDPGVVISRSPEGFVEYDINEAQFTLQLGSFELSVEKTHNVWGVGRRGNIIFSTKAPSYPQFKLRVPLSDWLDFVYVHADLNSNVLDSSRSYQARSSSVVNFFRPVDRLKYMAAHQMEFTPIRGVDISLGESVVYSDRGPLFIYFIPVMFFKAAEHYNRDTDNSQIFGSIDINLIRNVNAYASLFIDEIRLENFLGGGDYRNQTGFTAGIQLYDMPITNLELLVEYTRLNPWVYSHKYPAATFSNNGFDLGHWIGQNADLWYADISYSPSRSIKVGAFFERYRKGGRTDVSFQYRLPSLEFLYGPLRTELSFGAYAELQPLRDLFINAGLKSIDLDNEALPLQSKSGSMELSLGVRYGIW